MKIEMEMETEMNMLINMNMKELKMQEKVDRGWDTARDAEIEMPRNR